MRQLFILLATTSLLISSTLPIFAASFTLESEQIKNGSTLPESMVYQGFGCDGDNISPQLSWKNPPAGTKSYAITVYDPDAPTGTGWWHWTVFNIPNEVNSLPTNASASEDLLPANSVQGYTDFGSSEYGGACPPVGDEPHRYIFTVYALDVESLPADESTTGAKLTFLIKDRVLAQANITAKFDR